MAQSITSVISSISCLLGNIDNIRLFIAGNKVSNGDCNFIDVLSHVLNAPSYPPLYPPSYSIQ